MILGFFDSGLGGKVVMEAFQKEFPDISMILEMDRENAPYGEKSGDEIRALTKKGVEKLFDKGADVVIIACNTASVHALRWLQREVFPGRHILGVMIPGSEKILELGHKKVGVLATEATVRIRGYKERVHITDNTIHIEEIAAPGLVPLIEQGIIEGEEIDFLLHEYLKHFSPDIESLVLGCTHYPLLEDSVHRAWQNVHNNKPPVIIDPGVESAKKFRGWMERKGLL
ncbi:MAG: glutamate racemase [Candidatus Gracilibacteria bacterium]|nr:glutamate racemase [Candidatus Gracilibacteria bacterium]